MCNDIDINKVTVVLIRPEKGRKAVAMSGYHGDNGHCWDCDGGNGNHYPGCSYEGTGKRGVSYRPSGNGGAKFVFTLFLIAGIFVAALVPPLGAGIIILGAKITNV
jgi:hypothetical protein